MEKEGKRKKEKERKNPMMVKVGKHLLRSSCLTSCSSRITHSIQKAGTRQTGEESNLPPCQMMLWGGRRMKWNERKRQAVRNVGC